MLIEAAIATAAAWASASVARGGREFGAWRVR